MDKAEDVQHVSAAAVGAAAAQRLRSRVGASPAAGSRLPAKLAQTDDPGMGGCIWLLDVWGHHQGLCNIYGLSRSHTALGF